MIDVTQTTNPIIYGWWLANVDGASFELYPMKTLHNKDDINEAKRYLVNQHDIVSVRVIWMNKEVMERHSRVDKITINMLQTIYIDHLKNIGRLGINRDKKFVDLRLFPDELKVTNINKIMKKK
ncbi:MAG: hypothetical protein H8E51_07075 [Bacteroidetes bacterium]|nr:hypothetical protein [Bacteroidota bacterium]